MSRVKARMNPAKILYRFFLHVGFLISLGCPALGQTDSYIGTQFITYNGTITGHFTPTVSANNSSCPAYYIDPLEDSISQIGVNPPWDSNPFWFSISHFGQMSSENIQCSGACVTDDPIYNLQFQTAYDICIDNITGNVCGIISNSFHFVPFEILDLKKSSITRLQTIGGNKEQGYGVIGNQSSFVNNTDSPPVNSFDYQRPSGLAYIAGCPDSLHFEWNASTPFTYSVSFSNYTAEANFSLTAPYGTVNISYSGKRVDDLNDPTDSVNPMDADNYTAIALNSSNSALPQFMFANGSAISWKNYSYGQWGAIAKISNAVSLSESMLGRGCILLWPIAFTILVMPILY